MSWTDAWRWLCGTPPDAVEPVADPVHHTILVVELDGFAAADRTNMHRLTLRAGLYRVLQRALVACGVEWNDCYRADLGDGVLVLAPAGYPKAVFSELVPAALTALLAEHNRAHRLPERIRLRAGLHAGEVSYDAHGTTGAAIVHTFRLLHSGVLRDALARAGGDLAVIASAWFYEEIIRHSPVSSPDRYRPVFVQEKETTARGWVRLFGPGEGVRHGVGTTGRDDHLLG
jgi:class 3 adenylate cyclase